MVCGSGFQLGFWSGSCSSLSYLGCSSGVGGTVTFTINSLSPCQVVYLGMDGNAGANCSYDITMSNVVPLPIELIRFTAQNENGYNRIGWLTATEKDNAYFTLEKSEDGIHFEVLQKVTGANTSYVQRSYEVLDNKPFERTYYQLSQTDYDGTTKHLGIVVVDNKNTLPESISITPNPAQEDAVLSFHSNTIGTAEIRIADITGKLIESPNVELGIGKNEFHLNTSMLEKGIYFVSVHTRYSNQTIKLLKN